MSALYVFIGGGLGSVIRYLVSKLFYYETFPIGTLISNILACLILALSSMYLVNKFDSSIIKPLVLIGFCGGFSTFSTFSFETFQFIKQGNYLFAFLNILISVVFCLSIFYILKDRL